MSSLAEAYQKDSYCVKCGQHQLDCYCEGGQCLKCHGKGTVMDCIDDYCHSIGECIHGDERTCPNCNGSGRIYPERKSYEDVREKNNEGENE